MDDREGLRTAAIVVIWVVVATGAVMVAMWFAADDDRRLRRSTRPGWTLGLAAGPMAGFDRDGVDADLLAGTSWRSILVVNIGHPADDAWCDRLPRLDHADAVATT